MNTEDEARRTRTDAMIVDMEETIADAKETTRRIEQLLGEVGVNDRRSLEQMVSGAQCSPALRTMLEAERERIEKEMSDGERTLAGERKGERHHPQRRRRGMRRI